MNANLTPVTLDLPDELIAGLTLAAQAKGLSLEEGAVARAGTSQAPRARCCF